MKGFLKKQLGHLLFGAVVWLPIVMIIVFGIWIFQSVEGATRLIINVLPFGKYLPPGTGFAVIILLIYLSGIIFKKTSIGNFFAKIPILGIFLGQKNGGIMSLEKLSSLQPCLFLYSPSCPSYGFILSEEKVLINGEKSDFTNLHIYYPNVPTIVMGQVYTLRKEAVIKLGNSSMEIISALLYGSRSPESIKYLPWENEAEEEFKKRAGKFGLI